MLNYRQLQIGLILFLVMLFAMYAALDILHYELSSFATGTMASIWSIILLLIDAQGLAKLIRKENGGIDEPETTAAPDVAAGG